LYNRGLVEKPIVWLGTSLRDLRKFPEDARRQAGYQLYRIQQGLMPNDWKPVPSVGIGVQEVRIHTHMEHRVLYLARFAEAVYVLHAFEKRTQATRQADLLLAKQRLVTLLAFRKKRKEH
jgi:phage-related protein